MRVLPLVLFPSPILRFIHPVGWGHPLATCLVLSQGPRPHICRHQPLPCLISQIQPFAHQHGLPIPGLTWPCLPSPHCLWSSWLKALEIILPEQSPSAPASHTTHPEKLMSSKSQPHHLENPGCPPQCGQAWGCMVFFLMIHFPQRKAGYQYLGVWWRSQHSSVFRGEFLLL